MQRILRPDLEAVLGYVLEKLPDHSMFEKIPDYSSIYGKDPRAAYSVLALATLLSGVGWMQLPKNVGLRFFVASQLVSTFLLTFMGMNEIKKNSIPGIPVVITLLGLISVLFSSSSSNQYPAVVTSWTSIISWTLLIFLPGINEPQRAFASILFFLVLMICIGTLVVCALDNKKANSQAIISTTTAARIILINNMMLVASRLF